MKLTIIADDKTVVKDGAGVSGLPLKDFPTDIWAVEWNSTKGHIEKRDHTITEITDITPYNAWIAEWEAVYTPPVDSTDEEKFRAERNRRLEASDWTQLADSPLSATKKTEWATFRQTLRDLPANTEDFSNPTYPTEPT
tara:strand:- start:692 stop:1108 length:417 start_codon:yes stop_codon:yes gene_type:complete